MKKILKPTRAVVIIFIMLVFILGTNTYLINTFDNLPNFEHSNIFIIPAMLVFIWPIIIFGRFDINIGANDGWGLFVPNFLGYTIIIISNLILLYLISVALVICWKVLRRKNGK